MPIIRLVTDGDPLKPRQRGKRYVVIIDIAERGEARFHRVMNTLIERAIADFESGKRKGRVSAILDFIRVRIEGDIQ